MRLVYILLILGVFLFNLSIFVVHDLRVICTSTFSPILNMVNTDFFSPPPPAPPFPPPIYYRRYDSGHRPLSIAGTSGGIVEFHKYRRKRKAKSRPISKKPKKVMDMSTI